jgi:sulfoxide reductase catalytic subunit YedY
MERGKMRNMSSNLHRIHAWVTSLLIFTGLLLYSQLLRGTLAELRIYMQETHVSLGIVFLATILLYLRVLANRWDHLTEHSSRFFLTGSYILIALTASITGLLLYFKIDLQGIIGYSTLGLHKIVGMVIFSAVFYHVLYYLFSPNLGMGKLQNDSPLTNRRIFIRWGIAIAALVGGGSTAKWVTSKSDEGLLEKPNNQFNNCNQMSLQPIPSLGSLPPIGGGYKGEFEIFKVTSRIPCANSQTWQFRLFGLVDNPLTLSWSEFLEVPRKVQISNFHCITGWNVYDITYEGILLSQLLNLAKIKSDANYVKLYSADGVYTSSLSLEQAQMEDVMVVVLMDGKPIPSDLGGPARLIVPQMYAYKGVKWLNAAELIQEPYLGFWEERGYANDAWVNRPGNIHPPNE